MTRSAGRERPPSAIYARPMPPLTGAREYLSKHEGSALFDVNKLMHEAEQSMTAAREALDEDPLQASAAASRATTLAERAIAAPGRR